MASREVDEIMEILNREQRLALEALPRVQKSASNVFHQNALGRKKKCWEIDVEAVLRSLANLGIVGPTGRRRYWQTTDLGRKISHRLEDEANAREYGFPVERR